MDTITVTIISVIIGTIVSVVSMFILMLKFVKQPLDKQIDELRQDFQELRKDVRLILDKIIPPYNK